VLKDGRPGSQTKVHYFEQLNHINILAMVLLEHACQRILMLYFAGHKVPSIQKLLKAEGVSALHIAI